MRRYPPRRLLAVTPAAVLAFATPTAADGPSSLTAPLGSTKGSVVMDVRYLALQESLQMESRR